MYVLRESFIQAFQQLVGNKLRSFLSLLGIMIGIFCIIAVKSAVDSLEDNVRGSFDRLGNDVLYVSKFSWAEDPGQNYWKFARRPNPSINDYKVLTTNVPSAKAVTFSTFLTRTVAKFGKNSIERAVVFAVTEDYDNFHNLEYEAGRFFSPQEYMAGANRVVIGHKIAEELFNGADPIGRDIQILGRKMMVVGVIKQSGKDLVKIFDYDNALMVGFELARSLVNVKQTSKFGGNLQIKAADGVAVNQMKDEVTVALRNSRQLKPREESNFSINSATAFADILNSFFSILNAVGYIIGGFALIVGIFSVANIMFVSVKERTSIIGVKKALGAKQNVILLEFLIESIVLCLLGGLGGLVLVWGVLKGVSAISEFDIYLSPKNVIVTLIIALVAGVLAGFIPALQASRMDPVEAIRA
ncbi:MAG: ABC transporter permease [Saprospiraceae bacterium]|nr:ABC transporter permease [Saprospiraceae bacterium]